MPARAPVPTTHRGIITGWLGRGSGLAGYFLNRLSHIDGFSHFHTAALQKDRTALGHLRRLVDTVCTDDRETGHRIGTSIVLDAVRKDSLRHTNGIAAIHNRIPHAAEPGHPKTHLLS